MAVALRLLRGHVVVRGGSEQYFIHVNVNLEAALTEFSAQS